MRMFRLKRDVPVIDVDLRIAEEKARTDLYLWNRTVLKGSSYV